MIDAPQWLPPLVLFEDHGGDWAHYIEAVYAVFQRDFISNRPRYETRPVVCSAMQEDGREVAFWHLVQRSRRATGDRVPDLRRCERIPWPRPTIEHSVEPAVSTWQTTRQRKSGAPEVRILFWIEHLNYLVVLARKKSVVILVTAYCTDMEHQRRKLRKERDDYLGNAKTAL